MTLSKRFSRFAAPNWGALLFALTLPPVGAQAQTSYQIIDLGTLGGGFSYGYGINNLGQVTGNAEVTGSGSSHAFLYDSTGMHDLGTLGGNYSLGRGINNAGQVTGSASTTGDAAQHAFRYDSTGMHDLGTLGGTYRIGNGINNTGQMTGYSYTTGNSQQHAFLYDATGLHDLGTLGGGYSYGYGINNAGQVTGYSYTTGGSVYHAFLYDSTGMHDLGTLGGSHSLGNGINNSGQIVGYSDTIGDTATHAFVFDSTGMHDLGTLGGTSSQGYGINNSGQVVGYSGTTAGGQDAFLYQNGKMTDLNTLLPAGSGWTLTAAYSINDYGWMTGYGSMSGNIRAYILRPLFTVTGSLVFRSLSSLAPAQSVTFTFRSPGSADFVVTKSITPSGAVTLPNVPSGVYTLHISAPRFLSKNVSNVTVRAGSAVLPTGMTLLAGDTDSNNIVDVDDLTTILFAFNTRKGDGSGLYEAYPTGDVTQDGLIDVDDLTALLFNFDVSGDS